MNCTHRCGWSYWCVLHRKEICSLPLKERVAFCEQAIIKERTLQQRWNFIYLQIFQPQKDGLYYLIHPEVVEREVEVSV